MTLKRALEIFVNYYKRAVKMKYVSKPISYAMHETWKYIDVREKPRRPDEVKEDAVN